MANISNRLYMLQEKDSSVKKFSPWGLKFPRCLPLLQTPQYFCNASFSRMADHNYNPDGCWSTLLL